jgi:hypothetical protein
MLPSSRNLYKKEPKYDHTTLYQNVSRFYKKKESTIPKKIEEIRINVESVNEDIGNLYDLEPTYISSNISNMSNSPKSEYDDSVRSYNTHLSINKKFII